MFARTDYILRTRLVHEKANRSDAHNTLGLERTVLLMDIMIEIKSLSYILCLGFVYIRTQPILCVSDVITQALLTYYNL